MKKVKLHLDYAGYCFGKENEAIRGGRKQKIKFHAMWGLIEHPDKGWVLYDTGYTDRFYSATKKFPNKVYAMITKVVVEEQDFIVNKLKQHNIKAEDIKHIIITHFHADHVCGLIDFPNATFYASKKALSHTLNIWRPVGFTKGVLKSLLPTNLEERTIIIEEHCQLIEDEILGNTYDLFNDKSLIICSLPGHAAGQIGVLLETERKKYFLIADACWLKKSFEKYILPSQIVRLFFHSWKDFKNSLKKVNHFHKNNPDVKIVPTHCFESTSPLVEDKIGFNKL